MLLRPGDKKGMREMNGEEGSHLLALMVVWLYADLTSHREIATFSQGYLAAQELSPSISPTHLQPQAHGSKRKHRFASPFRGLVEVHDRGLEHVTCSVRLEHPSC